MYSREQLLNLLRENVLTIEFVKADGTKRKMQCTLADQYVAGYQFATESASRKKNDDVISVWDIEANAWRSFRIESVTAVEPGPTLLLG